mgnify:CR=1 FL=1
MPDPIERLPNLGPYIARRLGEIGVDDVEDLRALGAVEAYARLKFKFDREISLNALWAIDAALAGIDWRWLSDGRKAELRRQLSSRP